MSEVETFVQVKQGDFVRSFDFPMHRDETGDRACYVEGWVVQIYHRGTWIEELRRYAQYNTVVIEVVRDIFGGKHPRSGREGKLVYVPENGTPSSLGGHTDGIVLLSTSR